MPDKRDSDYQPWDQEKKLGPPPWRPDDPKVVAWEQAHGHDVRLKCYPEFGCLVREAIWAGREADREQHPDLAEPQ